MLTFTWRANKPQVPWDGAYSDGDVQRLRDGYQSKMQQLQHFQPGGPEKLVGADDPRHTLQESGGLADSGATQTPYLAAFDAANVEHGAERHRQKTEVDDLDNTEPDWQSRQQPEFAFIRGSLGVSRVKHIFRVHGDTSGMKAVWWVFQEMGGSSSNQMYPRSSRNVVRHLMGRNSPRPLGCVFSE